MKNYKIGLIVFLFIALMLAVSWQGSASSVAASFVVTDTPVPTDTPVTPDPTTPPPIATTVVPDPTTPAPEPTTPVPGPTDTPGDDPPPDETPVATPSVIPALGSGPQLSVILFYGTVLLALLGVVTMGWFKVWQAYRNQH